MSPNSKPIIIVDGEEYPGKTLDEIVTITGKSRFQSVDIYGTEEALKIYGERAKDGAVVVTSKKATNGNLKDYQTADRRMTDEEIANARTREAAITRAIKDAKNSQSQDDDKIFTKTEQSPQFTGGEEAWRKYLVANLKPNTPLDEGWKAGVYKVMVKFIVHTDGTVSDVTTEDYKGTKTAQHCIDVIKNAPNWQPAVQNGRKVNAYKKQPVTFVIEE